MIVRKATAEDSVEAVEVLRDSIIQLCTADHKNDPATLEHWLRNKNVEQFNRWYSKALHGSKESNQSQRIQQMTQKVLKGGENTDSVVLIGDKVHRTMSPNHEFIHDLLKHLEKHHFTQAPRFIGTDEYGREVLSYTPGEVPRGKTLTEDHIVICIRMLRSYHDVAAQSPLCRNQETICHNDFAPWNVIFQNDLPVGLIDFDDSCPGRRIDDIAYFLWTFLELGNDQFADAEQVRRIALLLKAYGSTHTKDLVDALLGQQKRVLHYREEKVAAEKDPVRQLELENKVKVIKSEMDWVEKNRVEIEKYF